MILPTKHILLQNSLIGVGAILLEKMEKPLTVSDLWVKVRSLPDLGTFERYTLAISFLYIVGAAEFDNGLLRRTV